MRALNMQALTNDIQREWPGATVWGKGDTAHQGSPSDHNEDDTPGSKPEQTDADNVPEHRALDVPTLGPMTMSTLDTLQARLLNRPENRARLKYMILRQTIWRRNGGWVPEVYRGDYHGHLHISGYAPDDENRSGWNIGPDKAPPTSTAARGDDDMYMIEANSNDAQGKPQKVVVLVGSDGTVVGPVLYSSLKGKQDTLNLWSRLTGNASDNVTAAVWNDTMEALGVEGWRYDENFVLQVPTA